MVNADPDGLRAEFYQRELCSGEQDVDGWEEAARLKDDCSCWCVVAATAAGSAFQKIVSLELYRTQSFCAQ